MKSKLIIASFFLIAVGKYSFTQEVKELMNQANMARQDMNVEKAVQLYTEVLAVDSMNVDAYYYRGWVQSMFNVTHGIEDFLKVIEIDSLHEGAYQSAARYYSFIGDDEKSEYYEQKAINLNPQDANNLLTQTRNEIKSGNYEKALELCNQSIALQDESSIWLAILERGEIYLYTGKYQEAISDFEKCFNDYGYGMYTSENFEMCGDAYEKTGQMSKACEKWDLAINHIDVEEPSETAIQKLKEKCNK